MVLLSDVLKGGDPEIFYRGVREPITTLPLPGQSYLGKRVGVNRAPLSLLLPTAALLSGPPRNTYRVPGGYRSCHRFVSRTPR